MKRMSRLIEDDHAEYENNAIRRKTVRETVNDTIKHTDNGDQRAMFSDDGRTVGSKFGVCRSGTQ